MLSGEGNENGENATIGLISKKVHFFGQFFVVVLHDYNGKLPETSRLLRLHVLWRTCLTCFFVFFFTISSFHPGCRQHCSFSHRYYKISCCSSNKKCLLCFSLSLQLLFSGVEFGGLSPYFFFFSVFNSLSLYSKFADMTINLGLILYKTRIQKHLPLSVFVFIDSLIVSAPQDVDGHTLSRQNNLNFGICLHAVGVRTVSVRTLRHNQIFFLSKVTNLSQQWGSAALANTSL